MTVAENWFLRPGERGNPATKIDAGLPDGAAWTEGNQVSVLVDGATYFARLAAALSHLDRGAQVRFTDWRGDANERLADSGPEIAAALAELCRRGVDVRGLLWRSHSDRLSFSAKQNRRLAREVNGCGGEVLLDERVRRGGSHHQKLVVLRQPDRAQADVAFVGGIDLCHGRRDDARHHGDAQAIPLDERYGPTPPWHDVELEVRGPAVGQLDFTFRERWQDPTPLDHSNRRRAWLLAAARRGRTVKPLPDDLGHPAPAGTHAVQVLRTYPSRRPAYPFAPTGERSVARAFAKAVGRARRLIYIEDQYLWSGDVAHLLAAALRRRPELRLIALVPRHPDKSGRLSGPPARLAQRRAIATIQAAGGARVAIYDLVNDAVRPVYVHAKVCVIDDVWATVGSDNLNRRSWTHDSELACAVIDGELDDRPPLDPAGLGDGSRRFARQLRLTLWAEHLGRSPDDPELLDPACGFAAWRAAAEALDRWHGDGGAGPQPPGRVRAHRVSPVPVTSRWWAEPVYRLVFDPDGRPAWLRRSRRF